MKTTSTYLVRVLGIMVSSMAALAAHAQGWIVGQVAPLTGSNAKHGRAYSQEMRLAFEQVNKAGGVQGQPLKLVTLDDRGSPEDTIAKTRELLEKSSPVLLAGYFGNKNLTALLDSKLLEQHRIQLVGYQSTDIRVLNSPQIFSTHAGVFEEIGRIATHLAAVGISRLALVYEGRSDAQNFIGVVTRTIAPSGAKLTASIVIRVDSASINNAVEQLQTEPGLPQAVLVVASSSVTSAFVEAYRISRGIAQIYINSEADIEQMVKRLPGEFMSGLPIAQVVPSPYKVNMRLNKEFRDVVAARGTSLEEPMSYTMMQGYVNGKVIAETLRRSQPVAREKLGAALRDIDTYDLGGYWVSFKSGSQTGSKFVDLSVINGSGRVTH